MRSQPRHRFAGLFLTLMLTLATLAGGFAHRAAPNADDMARLSHALFWGEAVADLCGEPGQPGTPPSADCPACTLIAAAVLPEAAQSLPPVVLAFSAVVLIPATTQPHSRIHDPARPVRAPPQTA